MEMFHLLHAVNNVPWVMEVTTLRTLLDVFDVKMNGQSFVAFDKSTRSDWRAETYVTKSGRTVDYLYLRGTMVPRTGAMVPECGMLPMVGAREVLLSSESDDIFLHVDSGGGAVVGVPEFADAIKEVRARGQRVIAYTDTVAASGGYWAIAHADQIIAAPSARVGSIGVYTALTKRTNNNYKTYIIKAGDKKAYGSPDLTITDEEVAYFKDSVLETYKEFTESVAEGRRVSVQSIVDTQAGVYAAKKTNLLVDEIMPFTQIYQEMINS